MNLNDIQKSLDKQFITRYGKRFAELNKNVYITPKNDAGSFEVATPVVGEGGGTLVIGKTGAFSLEAPAVVTVKFKNMKPLMLVYRLSIPYAEAEIAAKTPGYFNYLFDIILNKALGNIQVTIGKSEDVRFGESYCTYESPGSDVIFRQLENMDLELRLYSSFASQEEDFA